MPQLWLIAGPNGSGKSTLASSLAFRTSRSTPEEEPPVIVNPDRIKLELSKTLVDLSDEALSLRAAEEADRQFHDLVLARRSVIRETVLSTDRLLQVCSDAQEAGFHFGLFYVFLNDPWLNVNRVMQRVRLGGHSVPEDKIIARWTRSISLLPKAAEMADSALVWDNSLQASDEGEGR